ncbi:MAG: CarD family transcriptional regulator [Deltaproteobacteria bacterium]|nr:CarD family transcriptional regulator [Deltaproteobacteria bacterium]MCL5791495.1 CarD family transcriptional regulator [Deltaproteobacteria bacterium]
MFKVGDIAVYPAHGVGKIVEIEMKEIGGGKDTFYVMKIFENNMKVMVPTHNANAVGLRRVISNDMVSKVFEIFKEKRITVDNQTWNRRFREYTEKIKTGSVFEIAEVLKDLYLLKTQKDLSFGERKLFDTAKNLLLKELVVVTGKDEEVLEKEINSIFGR